VTTREAGDMTRKAGDTKMNQRHKFDAPVPKDAIQSRQQSGQSLSYLDGHYIITKTNELLGHENWSYTVNKYQIVQTEEKENAKGKINQYVGYVAQVTVNWGNITRSDVGFGQGIDNDLGRAHESAIKEAATDALKRALRTFGQAFGLALYDKSGAHIAEPFNAGAYAKTIFTAEQFAEFKENWPDKTKRDELLEIAWSRGHSTLADVMGMIASEFAS
jgi:DNA repair and recombination protein RAD52